MKQMDPNALAAKWSAAMKAPTTAANYKAGISATTDNPMAKAASPQAQQLYAQRTQDAVSSGRMAQKLNAVPMSTWQNNSINVGANALSTGATKAQGKVQAHFQKFGPAYAQASQAAAAIPNDGTMASALLKVQASITVLKSAAGKPTN